MLQQTFYVINFIEWYLFYSGNRPMISADILCYLFNKMVLSLIHNPPWIIAYILCGLFIEYFWCSIGNWPVIITDTMCCIFHQVHFWLNWSMTSIYSINYVLDIISVSWIQSVFCYSLQLMFYVWYSTEWSLGSISNCCTMPMMWLGKCVCVVLVVNFMIHSYILV